MVTKRHVCFVGSSVFFECNNECGGSVVGYVLEEFVGWNSFVDELFAGVK